MNKLNAIQTCNQSFSTCKIFTTIIELILTDLNIGESHTWKIWATVTWIQPIIVLQSQEKMAEATLSHSPFWKEEQANRNQDGTTIYQSSENVSQSPAVQRNVIKSWSSASCKMAADCNSVLSYSCWISWKKRTKRAAISTVTIPVDYGWWKSCWKHTKLVKGRLRLLIAGRCCICIDARELWPTSSIIKGKIAFRTAF